MKIRGKIHLTNKYGDISDTKIYHNKFSRNVVIEKWKKLYPNTFYVVIEPTIT